MADEWQLPYCEVSPSLTRLLRSGQRQLWWESSAPILGRAMLGALSLLLGATVSDLFIPLPLPLFWLAGGLFFLWGAVLAARQRPSPGTVARVLDRRLHLRERLATALEVAARGEHGPLGSALLAEVSVLAGHLLVRSAFPRRFPARQLGCAAALLGAIGLLSIAGLASPRAADGTREGLPGLQIRRERTPGLSLAANPVWAGNMEMAPAGFANATGTNAGQQRPAAIDRAEKREGRSATLAMAGNAGQRPASLRQPGRPWQDSAARQQMAGSPDEAADIAADKTLAAALRRVAQALAQGDTSLLSAAVQELARQIGTGDDPGAPPGGDARQGRQESMASAQAPGVARLDDYGEVQVSAGRGGGAAPGAMPDGEGRGEGQRLVPAAAGERKRPLRDFGEARAEIWTRPARGGEWRSPAAADGESEPAPRRRPGGPGQLEEDTPEAAATRGVASATYASADSSVKGRVETRAEDAYVPWAARSYVREYFSRQDGG